MNWINPYQIWLSENQSLSNAQLVANHLIKKGWTPEAISALVGNMRHESSVNPNMYEYGYSWSANRGFGLVQWTPRNKYWDWAISNGYSESSLRNGDAQLARIDYEVENNLQWISTNDFPLSFSDFRNASIDNYTLDYLTEAFMWNYERPNRQAGLNSLADRIAFAIRAYNELDFTDYDDSIPDDGTQLAIFPMDVIYITQGEYGSFTHYPGSNQELAIDFAGWADGVTERIPRYPLRAPFDSEVIDIYHQYAQVIWRSTVPVMAVNGTKYDVLTYTIVHDDNIYRWSIGDRVSKGDFIGYTGTAGLTQRDHLHLQVFNADYHPWPTPLNTQLHIYDIFDTSDVTIYNGFGYPWKTSNYQDGSGGGIRPIPPPVEQPGHGTGLVARFISQFIQDLEKTIATDVYKQGNSDYYKNSWITLQKQMDNTYKIKPSLRLFEEIAKDIRNFLNNLL